MIELLIHALIFREGEDGQLSRTIHVGVRCEQCGQKYGYAMTRSTLVKVTRAFWESAEKARLAGRERARKVLDRKLARQCDPVPCPECGWYQKPMLAAARRERFPWIPWSTWFALVLAGTALVLIVAIAILTEMVGAPWPGPPAALSLSVLVLLGCAAFSWISQQIRAALHDPNATLADYRIERGSERALTWEEFKVRYADYDEDDE